MKAAERVGNARGTGTRHSDRWQKSVGRIARLVRLEVARPLGEIDRALAGRKLEALPDAGHERIEGETVRGRAFTIKSQRSSGVWVSARRFFNTTEGVLGLSPGWPSPAQSKRGPQARRSIPGLTIREERDPDSASGGTETGRACLRVTTRASEVDTVR